MTQLVSGQFEVTASAVFPMMPSTGKGPPGLDIPVARSRLPFRETSNIRSSGIESIGIWGSTSNKALPRDVRLASIAMAFEDRGVGSGP